MLHLNAGVNPHKIQPEVLLLIQIVSSIYARHGADCAITSLYDDAPNRLVSSYHRRDGVCRAVDFRTVHLTDMQRQVIFSEIRTAVGYAEPTKPRAFDFVFEPRVLAPDGKTVTKEQHFHGEYDPKFPGVI